MNFSPVRHNNEIIGHSAQHSSDLFFFGSALSSQLALKEKYPALTFYFLKQVHGCDLVEANTVVQTADAHWTSNTSSALVIASADCIPILISHPKYIVAIHAGWRGVKSEILFKSFQQLNRQFGPAQDTHVVFGPHIHGPSFEVDLSLANEFQKQFKTYGSDPNLIVLPHHKPKEKAYVNLSLILRQQILRSGVGEKNISEFAADTFSDTAFASYRRERGSTNRNLSFVARLAN